ncbi:MAG TPA: hypothetical protein VG407_18845 [Caulobacteraceae bacterium]|jgi:hypothetical protein|nr:hypothetical protein [Caulobacteraceae bacterium]
MRHSLSIAALTLSLAFAATQAVASVSPVTTTQSVTVNGSVAEVCVLGSPNPPSIDLGQMAATSGERVGKLGTISDHSVNLPDAFCNYPGTQISVAATALVEQDESTTPSGFSKAVNFTANVSGWTSSAASVTTAAAADGSNATSHSAGAEENAPQTANLTLTLTNFTAPGDGVLVAGSYNGLVTITLGPDGGN